MEIYSVSEPTDKHEKTCEGYLNSCKAFHFDRTEPVFAPGPIFSYLMLLNKVSQKRMNEQN